MEESAVKRRTLARPISELLPGLSGILSKEDIQAISVNKRPRGTMMHTRTVEKVVKPLTLAEMSHELSVLYPQSPRRPNQSQLSVKKKEWNSSTKVNKGTSHTADGCLENNRVRKVLQFPRKPKAAANPRMSSISSVTPKFQRPELRAKKSLHLKAKNHGRISGICNIPQTPETTIKPTEQRITIANKENKPCKTNLLKTALVPPTPRKKTSPTPKIETLLNSSWKSGSDSSFIQKEKEIEVEEKIRAITEEQTLENIAEVSPPISTPFKEYRSFQECFNNVSYIENSALNQDNTIMCFDKPSISNEDNKREESFNSLCDLFNKTTLNNEKTMTKHTDNSFEVEMENYIKMMENDIKIGKEFIKSVTEVLESKEKHLFNLKKLMQEKKYRNKISDSDQDKTFNQDFKETKEIPSKTVTLVKSPTVNIPCSGNNSSKSLSYKIPKKNLVLRKSIVNKTNVNKSPVRSLEGTGLTMYMKMKEQNFNFLNTPQVNRHLEVSSTPAVTSHNLQKQLDKLYGS